MILFFKRIDDFYFFLDDFDVESFGIMFLENIIGEIKFSYFYSLKEIKSLIVIIFSFF